MIKEMPSFLADIKQYISYSKDYSQKFISEDCPTELKEQYLAYLEEVKKNKNKKVDEK